MKSITLGPPAAESEEITQLRDRVRALELRLDWIEERGALAGTPLERSSAAVPKAAPARIDTEIAAATIFKRIAMLCFVLLGALILRVLTQQSILDARFGTVLGFLYTGHLIVLSLIPGRFGGFARQSSLFQCSGAVLAFVIAIESTLRTLTMGRMSAMVTIVGFALLAVGMAVHQKRGALAGTGILGGILALVALDIRGAGMGLQMASLVVLAAAGIASSWRQGWGWLRVATSLLVLSLLGLGFFFGRREPDAPGLLMAASAGIWCVMALQHLIVFRRLERAAAWLPLTTAWFAGIQHLSGWPLSAATNAVIGMFGLATVIVCSRYAREAIAGTAGMIATSALAGAVGWVMLDRTGLLCALAGIALWFAGRRAAPDWASIFATLLMLAATFAGLAQLFRPPVSGAALTAMCLSALAFVGLYIHNSRRDSGSCPGLEGRLAPVALAAGLALLLGLFWELLNRLFAGAAPLLLSQTVVLVLTAVALTFWGHATRRNAPLFCGLACMALALAKVLLIDLIRLKSVSMLVSLVLVSLASVAVSVILRRRS